jgi:diaminopimelate decarboxylase
VASAANERNADSPEGRNRRPLVLDSDVARDGLKRFGSPLYLYDADVVRAAFREVVEAFPYAPLHCHYAIVCNKNHYLVRLLLGLGAGIHANTPGDAHAALSLGIPSDRIVYSGTNLTPADFDFLLGRGIHLNLDSLDQLRDLASRGRGGAVGLRLLVEDESGGNRIGVAPSEIDAALDIAGDAALRLTGLHMYAGTNTLRGSRLLDGLEVVLAASARLPDLEYVDLGGGFGVAYAEDQSPLDLREVGREVARRLTLLSRERGRPIRLLIEPGRTLVAAAGTLLVTVVSVKARGGRRYVGVDSTVGNIVVESVYHPYHRVEALEPRGPALDLPTDICGNTTHSRDYLGRSCRLPELRPGDVLALRDVGAYGYAMSSHFLNRPRPAEVVLDGGELRLTTRRETFDDLIATQLRS